MSPEYYQSLLDRYWRRSGALLYRPNQREACCPHYTLRLDSSKFHATKDQRHAINRFNKYVAGDEYTKKAARLYPRSREQAKKRDVEFDLVERIHEAEAQTLKNPPHPLHDFEVTLEPDVFSEEKYAVFENYQRIVHHEGPESISRDGFKRFLCGSPLRRSVFQSNEDSKERQLGSYHQCYRLDGKLVAIGVLDLLPDCVSAVYFLYHESIHKWQPGKLGALREIALATENGYRWWYPGYYIHTCPKMKYKMDYAPQYLLEPDTLEWEKVDDALLARFDSKGYLERPKPAGEEAAGSGDGKGDASGGTAETFTDDEQKQGDSDDEEEHSLFDANMPGIPPLEQMRSVDLDHIPVRLNRGFCFAGDIFQWDDEDINSPGTPKAAIAQMVAAVGTDLVGNQTCLDFRRGV
ncbi:arginine-trna-protein transferase 1 [Apiospora saccharicola]|uniref:arginyltransferase n=1 Tax=Apiospora saccharicola TaxID=335842 RepID=A0ABR1W3Z5_9PEZI